MVGSKFSWLWVQMRHFRRDRRAVTAIEYVLIASLVATVIISGVTNIGGNLGGSLRTISSVF